MVLVEVEAILTLFAAVLSVLKYNSATPFVTKLNEYVDVLEIAKKPLSHTVCAPLVVAVYEAICISEYWAFDDGWAVAKLADVVDMPESTIRVIPRLPAYSWLATLFHAGTWHTMLDVLVLDENDV